MNKHISYLLVLVAVLLFGTVALAAGQPAIAWEVISGGGGTASAGNIEISDTIGQPIIGLAQAGDVIVESGFWSGAGLAGPTATPTPTPTTPPH
ncbi:MAG: hypothetical protein GXP37_06135, partial [Chloroflexi bacterium]|nr:hypothetical protein [Chloroflexota bacterium]